MAVSRRSLLRAAAASAALVTTETVFAGSAGASATPTPAVTLPALPPKDPFTGHKSPNGWPVNRGPDLGGTVWSRPVVGTGFSVDVAIGEVETILVHVVRRFHYEIATLGPGDVIGFRAAGGLRGDQLNHASGTAVDIRPGHYPPGTHGGFYPNELAVIRDILGECGGVVRWGGDFATPDEAHFQIDRPPADPALVRLASTLRGWRERPSLGAGILQNPADRHRQDIADQVRRSQT
jgi:hypothetical protein